ncbi:MAG TPA: PepSY-associated TM helix domain-containing protein, partial [Verrucomicrobiae bacterium]|nr:PepSY-associated TM helix domain-containing protein [Verrucomicrobiae bacterium]
MGIVTAPISRPVKVRSKANWLHSPQRVWLRRAVFQIHLWAGVALSLYCVAIGLSGSALVFRSEIDDWLHSELRIQRGTPKITTDAAVHAIETARPGWHGVGLEDLDKTDRATALLMRQNNAPLTANYRQVSFNPYTGQVVLDRMRYSGVLGWMTNLHYYLLAGDTGLLVSGWMAIGLLLLCVTGLILWWPGVRRWASRLILRRRASWRRINWDLHVVTGFWANALLLVITLTGIYFAFPDT